VYDIIEGIIIIAAVGGAFFFILRRMMKTFRGKRPDCCSGGAGKGKNREKS
jgi:hypothetical protein